jgi:hypothetical protein
MEVPISINKLPAVVSLVNNDLLTVRSAHSLKLVAQCTVPRYPQSAVSSSSSSVSSSGSSILHAFGNQVIGIQTQNSLCVCWLPAVLTPNDSKSGTHIDEYAQLLVVLGNLEQQTFTVMPAQSCYGCKNQQSVGSDTRIFIRINNHDISAKTDRYRWIQIDLSVLKRAARDPGLFRVVEGPGVLGSSLEGSFVCLIRGHSDQFGYSKELTELAVKVSASHGLYFVCI